MTAAAAVFCCTIALAFLQGFGAPAFVKVIASDAIGATLPFLGILIVARFAAVRLPAHAGLVRRVHVIAQALLATMAFGWWWIEPHAALASLIGGSLVAMAWQAVAGALVGLALALLAERASSPSVFAEVALGTWVLFLIAGGRIYRAFDQVESGMRLSVAISVVFGFAALAMLSYMSFRRRERLAMAVPALAPAVACLALLVASRAAGPQAPASGDSIVLVVVDTLRADIADAGMQGMPDTMPELARIARSGVRFTQAVSPAPWTLPATVSLLSGWNPHRHRYGATLSTWDVTRGDPSALYMAGALRDAGYLTAAFVHNPYLRPWFGFGAGYYALRPYHGRAMDGVALALDWMSDHLSAPSFTLLHLMDPHWPYEAPPGFGAERRPCTACDSLFHVQFDRPNPEEQAEVRRRYAAEVSYTDAILGRFYDALLSGGALEHSWLIITADHGEEFWEHGGFMHGHTLYDELLRVPLVVVPPLASAGARRGVRIDDQVRLEDVAATMLDIAGLDVRRAVDGQTLTGLMAGTKDPAARVAVAGYVKSPTDLNYAVRRPPWKAIFAPTILGVRLFRLDQDPGEKSSRLYNKDVPAADAPEYSRQFLSLKREPQRLGIPVLRERVQGPGVTPDADTRRALRSLGYAQ